TRVLRAEIAHRLQVHGLGVVEDAFLAEPGLRDGLAALRPRSDEVELVPGRDEALEHDGAVLVDLELREELAVVEADAELVPLLEGDAFETRHHAVVAGTALPLREQVPPDLALVRKLHVEFLSESSEI